MTVVITVTVLPAISLLNYPCVFTSTEASHSSHFNYTFILLSHFYLFGFLLFTRSSSLTGSTLLWRYSWVITAFRTVQTIQRKLKRWNQSFHRDPVTSVMLCWAPGSPSSPRQTHATSSIWWKPWITHMHSAQQKIQSEKFLAGF